MRIFIIWNKNLRYFYFFAVQVEFPDAKILEEIFVNAVLFESKDSNENNIQACTPTLQHQIISDDDLEDISRNANSNQSRRGNRS